MKRIDTGTRAIDLFGLGKHGFKNGDLANGIAPTDFNADWPNNIQEEIANVIEAVGIVLDGADRTQLLKAIRAIGKLRGAPGTFFYFAGSTPPAGAIKSNGAAVSRTVYSDLFAAIGTRYGAGDGSTTFNVPEGRAEFIRGLDDGRGVDVARVLGSPQGDAIRNIVGYLSGAGFFGFFDLGTGAMDVSSNVSGVGISNSGSSSNYNDFTFDASRVVPTASENRPRNLALLPCILY
jgi:phage-related tail fiber protein